MRARRRSNLTSSAHDPERGATLVEYGLGLVFFALALSGGAAVLGSAGEGEVANQANCVSERPPPSDCLVRTVTTTTTAPPGGDPVDPPPPPPSPAPPLEATVTVTDPQAEATGPLSWRIRTTVSITALFPDPDDPDNPVAGPLEGALVRVRIRPTLPPSPTTFIAVCTTGPTGSCTIEFDVPDVAILQVSMVVDDILLPDQIPGYPEESPPAGVAYETPPPVIFDRPLLGSP